MWNLADESYGATQSNIWKLPERTYDASPCEATWLSSRKLIIYSILEIDGILSRIIPLVFFVYNTHHGLTERANYLMRLLF